MRKSFTAAVALVVALTIAAPVVAAPRQRNQPPSFTLLMKKLVKRVFGIGATAEPVIPVPLAAPSVPPTTSAPSDPSTDEEPIGSN